MPVNQLSVPVCVRLTAELQEKEKLIEQLKDQLHGQTPSMHQDLESEMSDRISNSSTVSVHDSLQDLQALAAEGATEGTNHLHTQPRAT